MKYRQVGPSDVDAVQLRGTVTVENMLVSGQVGTVGHKGDWLVCGPGDDEQIVLSDEQFKTHYLPVVEGEPPPAAAS